MRLPIIALALASVTLASNALGKPQTGKRVAAHAGAHGKSKARAALTKRPLPPLPAVDANDGKAEAKVEAKADKAEPKKVEPKIANPYDDPPEELTGALPQKKLADKKKKADADAKEKKGDAKEKKTDAKGDKKADAKAGKDKKDDKLLPHSGKPLKVGEPLAPPGVEFQNLQKKAAAAAKKAKVKTCLHPAVAFARLGQATDVSFVLTTCEGAAAPGAIENLSILARPYDVPAPAEPTKALAVGPAPVGKAKPAKLGAAEPPEVAPGIRKIDPGLVSRLQAIADKFPGKTITLVSGYRPASKGSPHQAARAMDIRIDGVTNEALVAFCKTLNDTGCGYYPNSYFVHVDVRPAGHGHVSWIDISGPGETPQYVKQWPLPAPAKKDDAPAASGSTSGEGAPTETATTTDHSTIGAMEEDDDESDPIN
jgi:hypothetical protein